MGPEHLQPEQIDFIGGRLMSSRTGRRKRIWRPWSGSVRIDMAIGSHYALSTAIGKRKASAVLSLALLC